MGEIGFEGAITRGLGKGAVFLSIGHYKEKIKEKIGFEPHPGTLNLQIGRKKSGFLNKIAPIRVEGFKKEGKAYGGASCYKIRINGISAAIIVPDLTNHGENMVEVIAPVDLKSELNVKDGDKVNIELVK